MAFTLNELPEEHRSAESLKKFTKSDTGEVDVGGLFKSYSELEKLLGGSIRIPGENATEEEKADFRRKLGVPDKPEEYGIAFDGADPEFLTEFTKVSHELGIPKVQAQKLADWYYNSTVKKMQALNAATQKHLEEEWGADYDKNLLLAKRVMLQFVPEEDATAIEFGELGSNPTLIKIFHGIAKAIGEGRFLQSQGGPLLSDDDLRRRLSEIQNDPDYFNTLSPKYRTLQKERDEIYKKLYPPK